MDKNNSSIGALEALLFSYGEPLAIKKISGLLKLSEAETISLAGALEKQYQEISGGLALLRHKNTLQLISAPAFGPLAGELLKSEFQEEITPAGQETLAIVAYAGPIPRSEIEYIRGVNSSFTIRNLLLRGLIERAPNPKRLNTFNYSLSADCLRHLGLTKIEELPEYARYKSFSEKFRAPGESVPSPDSQLPENLV